MVEVVETYCTILFPKCQDKGLPEMHTLQVLERGVEILVVIDVSTGAYLLNLFENSIVRHEVFGAEPIEQLS